MTDVEPTESGARATLSISDKYKIPIDASANVRSVTAVGEQYIDLVSPSGNTEPVLHAGPDDHQEHHPAAGRPGPGRRQPGARRRSRRTRSRACSTRPRWRSAVSGRRCRGWWTTPQTFVGELKNNIGDINDIVDNSPPIFDSQAQSADAIYTWAANLNSLTRQAKEQDAAVSSILRQGAPAAEQLNTLFVNVKDGLPQTLANLEIIIEMLKRYNKGVEQSLVLLPQGASAGQAVAAPFPNEAKLDLALSINQPPPCLTGFLPASAVARPGRHQHQPVEDGLYCKIPQETPSNTVRGARNFPCVDVPGKRAATPMECRSNEPYVPLGTNPWYGDPNQILNCPAPGARCDQPSSPAR